MKTLDYHDEEITIADAHFTDYPRNLAQNFFKTKHFQFAYEYDDIGGNWEGRLYSYDYDFSNKTLEASDINADDTDLELRDVAFITYTDGVNHVLRFIAILTNPSTYLTWTFHAVSSNDGGNWLVLFSAHEVRDGAANDLDGIRLDLMFVNSRVDYTILAGPNSSHAGNLLICSDMDMVDEDSTGDYFTRGHVDETTDKFYYLSYDSVSDVYRTRSWNGTSLVTEETIVLSHGTSIDPMRSATIVNGSAFAHLWEGFGFFKDAQNGEYTQISATGTDLAIHYYRKTVDQLSIKYASFGNRLIDFTHENYLFMLVMQTDIVVITGFDEIAIDENLDVYSIEPISSALIFALRGVFEVASEPTARGYQSVLLSDNEYKIIYDDSDNIDIQGYAKRAEDSDDGYEFNLESPAKYDLDETISIDLVDATDEEVLAAILEDCVFIIAGKISGAGGSNTFQYREIKRRNALNKLGKANNRIWYLLGDLTLNYDLGTSDSGIDLIWGTDKFGDVKRSFDKCQYSKVVLTGGPGPDGQLLTATAIGNANYGTKFDNMYHIRDQTVLNQTAQDMLTSTNKTIKKYKIGQIVGKSRIQVGYQVDYSINNGRYTESSAKWFFMRTEFDFVNKIHFNSIIYESLYFPEKDSNSPALISDIMNSQNELETLVAQTSQGIVDASIIHQNVFVQNDANFTNLNCIDKFHIAGESLADNGWTNADAGGATSVIISSYGGHSNVIQQIDNTGAGAGDARIYRDITSNATGSFECYIAKDVITAGSILNIWLGEAGNVAVNFFFTAGTFGFYTLATGVVTILNYAQAATWYHLRFEWNIASGWHLYVNGILLPYVSTALTTAKYQYPFQTTPSAGISRISFSTFNSTVNINAYYNALGYNDDGYGAFTNFGDGNIQASAASLHDKLLTADRPYCHIKDASLTCGTGAWTSPVFDTCYFDVSSMYTSGSSYIRCQSSGIYMIVATASWDTNTTGKRVIVIYKAAAVQLQRIDESAAVGSLKHSAIILCPLAKSDLILFNVYQDSGGDRTVTFTVHMQKISDMGE